ncbi:MAG: IclR family transcriptional regulator [Acidobacteria bacterium]|nr:IclR family transcriptional regulator [Acidobacteriota bacterium]
MVERFKTKPKARDRNGVQVIARAAEILRALEGSNGMSLGQLAGRVSLPKSTVQRIINALDSENFVVSACPGGRLRLGPALVRIAHSIRFPIAETARPYLQELSEKTGETVDLAVLDGEKAVFVDQIPGSHRLRAVSAIGVSFPLHCTANGKAMLAALDAKELSRLKKRMRLTAFTENSIRSWEKLEQELLRIRETELAYDREEHSIGISAIGTAIIGLEGEIAAITIPTPMVRFAKKEPELAKALQLCRDAVDRILGGAPSRRRLAGSFAE